MNGLPLSVKDTQEKKRYKNIRSHEKVLQKYIKKYSEMGYRVVRLDKRGIPDAIIIKDNNVIALLVDTSSLVKLYYQKKYFREKRNQIIRNYLEFDGTIQVCPQKDGHSVLDYYKAIEMYKNEKTLYKISKKLGITYSVIYDWIKNGIMPRSVQDQEILKNLVNTKLIYDEDLK